MARGVYTTSAIMGTEHLMRLLNDKAEMVRRYGEKMRVKVGYRAYYAIYVHENEQMPHPNGGQAKFLEQPARTMRLELAAMIREDLKKTKAADPMRHALLKAGKALLAASQELVPVDTSYLKNSGYVEID